jgi:DNA-binding CsgD family transcriptional regulator
VVRIEAADGRSLLMVLSTLRSALSPVGYGPVVAMAFVSDVGCAPSVPLERLEQTYQLTGSEARIALAAASGESPGAIAVRLRLSANTIKTHLRRVYEKLGIHRQAELVRLMSVLGLYQVL